MKNLVIITSVINISKNPLDYTSVRSVYTKEERYAQTLETIKSCEKIEDKEILFIETSGLELGKESNIKSIDIPSSANLKTPLGLKIYTSTLMKSS